MDSQSVSLIDIALSEGFNGKLSKAMDGIPEPAEMSEQAKDLDAEAMFKVLTDPEYCKEWTMRYVLENFYNFTGDPDTDMKAVMLIGTMELDFRVIF